MRFRTAFPILTLAFLASCTEPESQVEQQAQAQQQDSRADAEREAARKPSGRIDFLAKTRSSAPPAQQAPTAVDHEDRTQ